MMSMWTVHDQGGESLTSRTRLTNSLACFLTYDCTVNTMRYTSCPPAAALKSERLNPWMWHRTICYSWDSRLSGTSLWRLAALWCFSRREAAVYVRGRQREVCRPTAVWITGDSPHRRFIIDADRPADVRILSEERKHRDRDCLDPLPQPRGALLGGAC